jgi:hypothetical protein
MARAVPMSHGHREFSSRARCPLSAISASVLRPFLRSAQEAPDSVAVAARQAASGPTGTAWVPRRVGSMRRRAAGRSPTAAERPCQPRLAAGPLRDRFQSSWKSKNSGKLSAREGDRAGSGCGNKTPMRSNPKRSWSNHFGRNLRARPQIPWRTSLRGARVSGWAGLVSAENPRSHGARRTGALRDDLSA